MLTNAQVRKIEAEYFMSGECHWSEEAISQHKGEWLEKLDRLARGERIDVGEDMGSCQCGDIAGYVTVKDGVVWCQTSGRYGWQNYDGPAATCAVPYRVGCRARQLAMAWQFATTPLA